MTAEASPNPNPNLNPNPSPNPHPTQVFTTLLIFNLVIANKLLDERITPPKVAGADL